MKLRIQVLAVASIALLASCGNSADKTASGDTTATTTTTTTATTDNTGVGSTVGNVEVPATTKTTFEAKYPQASNVRWQYYRPDMSYIEWDWSGWPKMDTSDYVASFNWDGSDYWAWYDEEGNWIGTVNKISDHSSLPASVNNTIKSEYNGYTVVSVDKENDKNRTAYEIQLESGENKVKVLIDENGKVMKKKVISGDSKSKEKMN